MFLLMLHDPATVPDSFTYPFALKACAQLAALDVGEQIHGLLLKAAVLSPDEGGDVVPLYNALIHMYIQCDRIDRALEVFDRSPARNVVSWNSMIDGFAKSEDMDSARELFEDMPERNMVSWNSMIGGYANNGRPDEALTLFLQSQELGLCPDEVTMVNVLAAISDLGLLDSGEEAHAYITRRGLSMRSGALGVSLVSMYSRCGSIEAAHRLFEGIPDKNVAHWTAMITGLAAHGIAEGALQLFAEMLRSGVKPNHVTFMAILSACSHGGLVEEGLKLLQLMATHGVDPRRQHLSCAVDLLARAGLVEESLALALAGAHPGEAEPAVWTSLLSASLRRGNSGVAEIAASRLMNLDPDQGASYVLLSNVYASLGRWDEFSRMRKTMARRGVEKVPGLSWIVVGGAVHEFAMGDKLHRRQKEIYATLSAMESHLRWVDPPALTWKCWGRLPEQ
ncbi:unnamed protein product [Spirodela intermedia]|uniref:Uncharacterized protein n=1 Tax=Spirodela intermedia TaxID=51605 RepID=A0A7I8I8Q2_SPIIN|nr:unnamed protein product [Spirodela intermedia]CAA6653442.1 unnamed protein product [Spirodela intermedia]